PLSARSLKSASGDRPEDPAAEELLACEFLAILAEERILGWTVPAEWAGEGNDPSWPARKPGTLDVRALVLAREALAREDGLADLSFVMQGLGSSPITLGGSDEVKQRWLPDVARGKAVAAIAITEPGAGSDLGAISTAARRDGS